MTMLRELREGREDRELRHDRPARATAELRLVTPDAEARRRRSTRVLTGLVAAAACAVLFGTVCTHVLLTQGQADLDSLDARAAKAADVQQKLQVQVAELESPARIVPAARERLGMVPPPTVVYLTPGAPKVAAPTTMPPPTTLPASPTSTPTKKAVTNVKPSHP
jgi:cell division protein FtsL